ncbi:MAG: RND transporter [Ignavibacteriae bacterium HGW-Ignavibacteriae-2]|jgi:multidrug efflux pump subunit AcrB|nr:efflux RND transporter permease subunit [Bacteroidota bacterium]PKL87991.1 MAG: RND transporter [Ignavibacteriae bacterium HGW-Ignavibacteriae-2]
MRNLIKYFIKYPVLGNSIIFMVVVFGLLAYLNMKTRFFPDTPSKNITIQAIYPGASPQEIEEGITLKIEDNLKGLTGIERVTSVSSENSSVVSVELKSGYDVNIILQDVKNAVDQISSFPVGMEKITVFKVEPMNFAVSLVLSGDVELKVLKNYARRIERDLLKVEGISKIDLSGFPDEEIEISFRENDLRAYGLTFAQAANAVSNENIKSTGGTVKGKEEEFLIRADSKTYYAEDMKNLVLKTTANGSIIRLKDVADVRDKWSEDPNKVYYNGEPGVMISLNNTNEEDLFFIADYVKNYVKDFNMENSGVKVSVLRDGAQIVAERADILAQNGLMGMMLVILFLSLALNPRLSFWVALSIPVSFLGMLIIGTFYGLTINVMSLLAMILVVGILVDDGIVISENIYQHFEKGENPIQAAVNGTIEVLPSVAASVLTTVVIFATFLFLEGGIGDAAKDIAFVVIAALLFSLIEGMFILPAHIAHSKALTRSEEKKNIILKIADQFIKWMRDKLYKPTLKFTINNPLIAALIPVAILIITIGALQGSIVKTTFFPTIEGNDLTISLEMPSGTPAAVTDSILADMEIPVWAYNERYKKEYSQESEGAILAISRIIGPSTNKGKLSLTLKNSEERVLSGLQITNELRSLIGKVDNAENLEFGGNSRFGKPVSVALSSDNLNELITAKNKLKAELKKVTKLKDVVDNNPPGQREIKLTLKDKAFALGLTSNDVIKQVRSGFFGGEAQRIVRGIDEVKIWVRYDLTDRSSISKLENMRVRLSDGREFSLKDIASFEISHGVVAINHTDQQRVINVEADIADSRESVTDILADIRADIMPEIIKEFPDVTFDFEGQNRESNKTMNAAAIVMPVVMILMFLIIVVTFRSFAQATIVFIIIPFAIIGVVWGHFLQGYIISILSFFGVIALFGIQVNDSLVFIDAFNRLLKNGMGFKEALLEAGSSRFRPVILTSLTTIAGLGPIMFSTSHQAQFLSPMAISMAYGLLFGTTLTLLFLPSLLVIFNKLKIYIAWLINGSKPAPESVEPAIKEEQFIKKYESYYTT